MKQGEQQALHDVICPLSFFDAENVKQNKAYHAGHISLYPWLLWTTKSVGSGSQTWLFLFAVCP